MRVNKPRFNRREIKIPKRLDDYELYCTACCLITEEDEPKDSTEVNKINQGWKQAINKELETLEKYGTWTPTNLPKGRKSKQMV